MKKYIIIEDRKDYMVLIENRNVYWYLNGKYHREKGPAIFNGIHGCITWRLNGYTHRLDGPAVIYSSGGKYWSINGKRIKEQKHTKIRTMLAFGLDKI
jgi:hypothetical protein